MIKDTGLVALVARLSKAKSCEREAKEERIAAEEAVIDATGFEKREGQESYGGFAPNGTCRITLKQPITVTVDSAAWVKLRRELPAKHPGRAAFKAKYSLVEKEWKALTDEQRAEVASVVTRKPGKVSVEIKELVTS